MSAVAHAPPAVEVPRRLQIVKDPLRLALFTLIVLTVSRIHQQYPAIAKLRPAFLLTLVVAAYAYLNPRYLAAGSVFRTWPARTTAALGILACLSAPFGISLGNSGKFILDVYSRTLILEFLLIAAIRSADDLYTFAWAYVIGAAILSYLSLFVFKLHAYGSDFSYARLAGLLSWDANDVGCVLMPALALTLLLLQTAKLSGKLVCAMVLLGIGGTIARSGSRGGLVALVGFGIGLLLLVRGVSTVKRVAILLTAGLALNFWAPPGYWMQMQTILSPKDDYNWDSKDGRRELAQRGIGYMKQHPLFGLGVNNFMKAECTISEKAKNTPIGYGLRCTPPHNSYVEAAAELGVPGFLLWTGTLIGGIIALLRLRSRLPRSWLRGTEAERFVYLACSYVPVGSIGFGVAAFFLTFAWLEIYYLQLVVVVGVMLSAEHLLRANGAAPTAVTAARAPGWRTLRPATFGGSPFPGGTVGGAEMGAGGAGGAPVRGARHWRMR